MEINKAQLEKVKEVLDKGVSLEISAVTIPYNSLTQEEGDFLQTEAYGLGLLAYREHFLQHEGSVNVTFVLATRENFRQLTDEIGQVLKELAASKDVQPENSSKLTSISDWMGLVNLTLDNPL